MTEVELRRWAIEQVVKLHTGNVLLVEKLIEEANKLIEFALGSKKG